jgi:CubicO group peptidase (beta-lactamase class C family)
MRIVLALALASLLIEQEIRLPRGASSALDVAVASADVPIAVVFLTSRDRVLYRGVRGTSPDAIFRIFSMTKPITSVAVMMLVEEGRIRIDDPVSKYLPGFVDRAVVTRFDENTGAVVTGPAQHAVTIKHLLTNTSGIAYPFSNRIAQVLTKSMAGKSDIELPLVHEPGTRWTYGPSTRALGDIVERVSGMGLEAFLTKRIFEPLGMKDTSFTLPPEKLHRLVSTSQRVGGKLVTAPALTAVPAPTVRGDYGLFSTAADYSAFLRMLLNDGGKLLEPETVRAMTSNQIGAVKMEVQPALQPSLSLAFPALRGDDRFGYGFHIDGKGVMQDRRPAGSYGWSGVMNTFFWVDPMHRTGVVVLSQLTPFFDPGVVKLLDAVEAALYP